MPKFKNNLLIALILSIFLLCSNGFADALSPYPDQVTVQKGSDNVDPFGFTLDYIFESGTFDSGGDWRYPGEDPDTSYWYGAEDRTNNLLSYTYLPTAVAGFYDGNDSGGLKPEAPNTGTDGNGLLNGEGGIVDGDLFYTTDYDKLQDLYGDDDQVNDPGWINLGKAEPGEDNEYENLGPIPTKDGSKITVNIGELLTLNFDFGDGTWELATDPKKKWHS